MWAAPDLQGFHFKMCYNSSLLRSIDLSSYNYKTLHRLQTAYIDHPSSVFLLSNKIAKSFSLMTTLTFKKPVPCQSESYHTVNPTSEASVNKGLRHKLQGGTHL